MSVIRIQRASEHNLKDVSLEIPRGALTVFTGVSGSGKSSLAFDTIYREGQRRFLESLPAYARRFLGGLERPRVDLIEGLSPTIAVDQRTVGRSPRSTVGTITEIHDYLRLLFARIGEPHCPRCERPIAAQSPETICDRIFESRGGQTALVCAPLVRERRGEHRALLEELRRDGHRRLLVDGEILDLSRNVPALRRNEPHTIEVVWDRLVVEPRSRSRWIEAIEKCLALSEGTVSLRLAGPGGLPDEAGLPDAGGGGAGGGDHSDTAGGGPSNAGGGAVADRLASPGDRPPAAELFSSLFACPSCGVDLPELEPRLFSFNSPHGACPACEGLGQTRQVDPDRIVSNPSLPFSKGGIALFRPGGSFVHPALDAKGFRALGARRGFTTGSSWGDLGEDARHAVLFGEGPYPGLVPVLERLAREGDDVWAAPYLTDLPCKDCGGTRLRPEARAVRVGGRGIHELCALTIRGLREWIEGLELEGASAAIAAGLRTDLGSRLLYLQKVGLGYLTTERRSSTLAGGEAQRLRLASQVGAGLQGVLFVLDEPSVGLHARDNERLLQTLGDLERLGNTVLVVEHDRATIEAADHVVDLGPGAGPLGGEIVAEGGIEDLILSPRSLTGAYLSGRAEIPVPAPRRKPGRAAIEIFGIRHNNLAGLDVRVPLGVFVAVTGVSGSGKSSLVNQVLRPALLKKLGHVGDEAGKHRSILGYRHVDRVVEIDQAPIGRTPRSNPATYVKVFDPIRELFARVPEARARGYSSGRFSFNKDGGRCLECGGAGVTLVELEFLAPVEVVCDACEGRRYSRETLEIRYRGRNIHDVLEMTIAEACELFRDHPKVHRPLETLVRVGLGYVKLGQPSTTLSGGEAQRVKLAAQLRRRDTGRTLYLLDEPTTGLHFEDVRVLLTALQELVERGNTVVVIEHNLDVIKVADHVIDLGPEAGEEGGRIVAEGTPEEVARTEGSHTGRALREVIGDPDGTSEGARPAVALAGARKGPSAVEGPDGAGAWIRNGPDRAGASKGNAPRDIEIRGALEHNLKNVDVRIPHGSITVITGVSGSGKSSLAFDTLFAEGQRRYLESLSTYARRFLGRLPAPRVREISGLSPTIAIDQKSASANPRSSVATVTEIHDYLRILYARAGIPHCTRCGEELRWTTPSRLAAHLVETRADEKAMILAPIDLSAVASAGGRVTSAALSRIEGLRGDLLKSGFTRVLIGGTEMRLDEDGGAAVRRILSAVRDSLDAPVEGARRPALLLVVDRVSLSESSRTRIAGSLEQAFDRGGGIAAVLVGDGALEIHTLRPSCPTGHLGFAEELSPTMFSPSSHQGACPSCGGLGTESRPDVELLMPRPEEPLLRALDPAFLLFVASWRPSALATLRGLCRFLGISLDAPFRELAEVHRRAILEGWSEGPFPLDIEGGLRVDATWPGLLPQVRAWSREDSWVAMPALRRFLRAQTCVECGGGRLRRESLGVTVGGLNLAELCALTVKDARSFFESLELSVREATILEQVLSEIENRLSFLEEVGLGYLALDRTSATLSGGEAQRIRLASQLGNRLSGVLYILDEPTVGLHQRDVGRLLASLRGLRAQGNTVVLVEHDRETLLAADWIVDVGPGAGARGGEIVAVGTPSDVARDPHSLTGRYLATTASSRTRARRAAARWMELRGVRHHNLDDIDASFPLECLTAVTGVSGSGKSSLVLDALADAVRIHLGGQGDAGRFRSASGLESLERLVLVDQRPIGRTPRSNPATYTGLWDEVRALYARLPLSRVRGYGPSRFSFNSGEGRCASCDGQGARSVEMHFLSDVWVPCEACGGRRFDGETLAVLFRGRSVGDILDLEADDAIEVFENVPKVLAILETLRAVGLGYVKLGQSADTLSGGEAQRLKLAAELLGRRGGGALYLLDEPTTGLHHEDVLKLLDVLQALVEAGNTVIVIEHQIDVIRAADWIVDLGPEAGDEGGRIVAAGPPEDVARATGSHTGRYLRAVEERAGGERAGEEHAEGERADAGGPAAKAGDAASLTSPRGAAARRGPRRRGTSGGSP